MARQWMKFFLDAGIPKESSAEYAVNFEENRMEMDMLEELDKEALRDLNITAMGDIIAILRQARKVLSSSSPAKNKSSKASLLTTSSNEGSSSPSEDIPPKKSQSISPSSKKEKKEKEVIKSREVRLPVKDSKTSVSLRLGPQINSRESSEGEGESGEAAKSVFNRLGSQQSQSLGEKKSPNKNIFERLGPEAEKKKVIKRIEMEERESRSQSPQEPTVTSSSESVSLTPTPCKGILKLRGTGSGSSMSRSTSAPNIIRTSKSSVSSKQKKRISFGENEIRVMEPNPNIKSRLGFGRCSSPPPPELDDMDDSSLKTELRKIAVGPGRFEIKSVMKVVNEINKVDLRDSLTPERCAAAENSKEFYVKAKPIEDKQLKIQIRNDEYKDDKEYKVDKVDLALRAIKLKSNLDQRREKESSRSSSSVVTVPSSSNPRKRLVKVETLEDGSVLRTEIDPDDPILNSVPIKKMKHSDDEAENVNVNDKKIRMADGHLASNFKIVRSVKSSSSLYADSETPSHRTLAQKADLARDKQDRRGKSEEVSSLKTKTSVKSRLDDGYKSDDTHSSNHKTSIRERVGSSRDRSEDLSRSRSFSRDRSPKHRSSDDSRERSQKHRDIRARVGTSRDRDDNRDHSISERVGGKSGKTSVRERLGDNRDNRDHSDHRDQQSNKKIFSRLGKRD